MNTYSSHRKRTRFTIRSIGVAMALLAVPFALDTAKASESGPSGANIGFDFTWDDAANPAGHSASFLETDGTTANNCSGSTLTASTKTCNFVFDYRINGVLQQSTKHASRWIKWANPTSYANGQPSGATGCSSGTSGSGNLGKAPLTLFDCFNANSFGQIFRSSTTGPLSQFRMSMTCLAPTGSPRYELYGLLYELSPDGAQLLGKPAAATMINLSSCPSATSWNGKTFSAANFAMMPMNFNNIEVTAGKFYGVYLIGNGVPGTPPPGAAVAMAAARAATVTTTTSTTTTTTTTTPWSSFKNQNAGNSKTTTTANTLATSTVTTPAVASTPSSTLTTADLGTSQIVKSAIRFLTVEQAKTYLINPLTPTVCLGAGHNLLFIKTGRCTVQVVLRSNGKIMSTVGSKVIDGTIVPSETVVAVADPTVAYFIDGTALVKPKSKTAIAKLAPQLRTASSIVVTGHSGNIGGEQANMVQLSQKRAAAVRSLIRARGTSRTVAIWSFGASVPLTSSKSNKQQDLNRRSEIYVIP